MKKKENKKDANKEESRRSRKQREFLLEIFKRTSINKYLNSYISKPIEGEGCDAIKIYGFVLLKHWDEDLEDYTVDVFDEYKWDTIEEVLMRYGRLVYFESVGANNVFYYKELHNLNELVVSLCLLGIFNLSSLGIPNRQFGLSDEIIEGYHKWLKKKN